MITMAERAELALRLVREAPVISWDTETSGLDWRKNSVVGYVICAGPDAAVYVPVRHGGGGNLGDPNCGPLLGPEDESPLHAFEVALAQAFLERRAAGHLTVMHNAQFDLHMSAKHSIYLGRKLEDTQINQALLDEYTRSYSLDACAKAHSVTAKLGEDLYAHLARSFGGQADRKAMANFWRLAGNDPIAVDYALGDGITTLELREAQIKEIERQELKAVHDLESKLIWTCFRLSHKGIKIDLDRAAAVVQELEIRLEKARAALPKDFNVRSAPQVQALMEKAGHTDWPKTEKGNPSFTEAYLSQSPEGRAIVNIRQLSNLLNTFLTPLLETHVHKGRVHSTLNQAKADEHGTISGRFSSSSPNLQQVPRRNKDFGQLFRSIFVPDEGYEFFESDISQQEPRLHAHYSMDAALLEGYNKTPFEDVHTIVSRMLEVPRDKAKGINLGIFYRMQPRALAKHLGWDLPRAAQTWNDWMALFPGIADFQAKAEAIYRQRGYVKTILGRRCRLDHPSFAYRASNRIIQGSGADMLKWKLLEADMRMEESGNKDVELLTTVHDSIVGQIRQGDEERKALAQMIEAFEDVKGPPFNLRVPFVMETGIGVDWAEATYANK